MLGSDQRLHVRRTDLSRVVHLVKISFAIGHDDKLRLSHAPRSEGGFLQSLNPADAFLFIDGFGIATASG